MQALPQQEPAPLPVPFVPVHAVPLVVDVDRRVPLHGSHRGLELIEDVAAVRLEVVGGDLQAHLLLLERLPQLGEQVGDARAAAQPTTDRLDDDLDRDVRAVVQAVVLLHRAVAGGFNHEVARLPRLVPSHALVDHVLVSAHVTHVLAALTLDELRESVRGDAVRHHRASRVLVQDDGGEERDEFVSVDWVPVAVDDGGSVHVGVEDDAQISLRRHRRAHRAVHGLRILRVGRVVWEVTVRVEELRAARVGAQRLQHALREEPAAAVAGVDDDLHAGEGLLGGIRVRRALLDELAERRRVVLEERDGLHAVLDAVQRNGVAARLRFASRRGAFADDLDVRLVQAAVACEELGAVAVEWEVRGGEHDPGVVRRARGHRRHETRGSRRESHVHDSPDAFAGEPREHGVGERGSAEPRVATHGDGEISGLLALLLREPVHEGGADEVGGLLVERHGLARDALQGDAADVGSVLQLLEYRGGGGGDDGGRGVALGRGGVGDVGARHHGAAVSGAA